MFCFIVFPLSNPTFNLNHIHFLSDITLLTSNKYKVRTSNIEQDNLYIIIVYAKFVLLSVQNVLCFCSLLTLLCFI